MKQDMELLWSNEDIAIRILAKTGGDPAFPLSKAGAQNIMEEMRDEYESIIDLLSRDNDRLFTKAARRLADIKELQALMSEIEDDMAMSRGAMDRYDVMLKDLEARIDNLKAENDALKRGAAPNADDLYREIAELRQSNIGLMAQLNQAYSDHRRFHDLVTATDGAWELIERQHPSNEVLEAKDE